MKKLGKGLGIMAALTGLFSQSSVVEGTGKREIPEELTSFKQGAAKFHFGKNKPSEKEMQMRRELVLLKDKGLATFIYDVDGEPKSVIALNQKNADRKARKNGWIV